MRALPPEPLTFEGSCDASGAVVVGGALFAVGDDEDNVLRIYDARRGGAPAAAVDLSPQLGLPPGKRPPETDIEAATGMGPRAYWLSSHGRKSSGKLDPSRFQFFATTRSPAAGGLRLVGQPYTRLLDDLLAEPRLAAFELERAAQKPPKEPGGLNIEGMTAMPDGRSVIIGFRSPRPQGKALVLPLHNPDELLEGQPARFGEPQLLDLGGLGIRSISWWRGRYLLIGGSGSGEGPSRLFVWSGGAEAPRPVDTVDFAGFNPEAFVSDGDAPDVLVLSDDGALSVDGVECKRQKDPARKRFRGVRVRLD